MDNSSVFGQLLRRSLIALAICAMLVALCYFFVDRPVAFFVHDQNFAQYPVLKWFTYPPPIVETWTPAVLTVLVVRRAWGPFRRWELVLFAACMSLIISEEFRERLGFVFGRYWPETWTHNNPSLIGDGEYGFHPFHDANNWYASFPSGHTARTVSVVSVVWIAYPWWRWLCVIAAGTVIVGLLGMDYHFVGDVIGGGFLGGLVGMYTAHFCGINDRAEPSRP